MADQHKSNGMAGHGILPQNGAHGVGALPVSAADPHGRHAMQFPCQPRQSKNETV